MLVAVFRTLGSPRVLAWAAVVACVPYIWFKVLWLGGGSVGIADAGGEAEMGSIRFLIGNLTTVLLEICAVGLVWALTHPWGRRLPAVVILLPMWVATGLLSPIVLGLPVGLLVQALSGGSAVPANQGLEGWVFMLVYGGFVTLGLCLFGAFVQYARQRWRDVLDRAPVLHGPAALVSSAVLTCYAAVMAAWSVAGSALGGPAGFETAAQRTTLAITGVLVASGVLATYQRLPPAVSPRWRVATAWTGTSVAVLSGPTHILLSNAARPGTALLLTAASASVAGIVVTTRLLRHRPGGPAASPERVAKTPSEGRDP